MKSRLRSRASSSTPRAPSKPDQIPLNFLSDADTTGGNSGSPVINGRGELVGLNFDRVWENVANDFGYNPDVARNISVDIRFLIWLLDAKGRRHPERARPVSRIQLQPAWLFPSLRKDLLMYGVSHFIHKSVTRCPPAMPRN